MDEAQFERLMGLIEARFQRLEARFDALETGIAALRIEMNERFESVNNRLNSVDKRLEQLTSSGDRVRDQVSGLRIEVDQLVRRFDAVDYGMYHLNQRIENFSDDMRQRFRVVNERLGAAA